MTKAEQKKAETPSKPDQHSTAANFPARRGQKAADKQTATSPFTLMRHLAEDMENMLADFGFGRRFFAPEFSKDFFSPSFAAFDNTSFYAENERFLSDWSPPVEMFERDGELIVRADLPGIKKDEVKIEITDRHLTIEGERKDEREEKGAGFYRSERSYGSFCREIALPEGVRTQNAKAKFKNGVLEISMESPQITSGKKRLEIGAD